MNGIEETWKDVVGYSGYYQVSNLGRVRSLDREFTDKIGRRQKIKGKIKSPIAEKDGYRVFRASIGGKQKLLKIHREVLKAFRPIDKMDKLLTNHINNVKHDNRLVNLEWVTERGNSRHYRNKTKKGRYNRGYKISDKKIITLVRDFLSGMTKKDIAKKYKVSESVVSSIVTRKTHRYIVEDNFDTTKLDLEIRLRKYKKKCETKKQIEDLFKHHQKWLEQYYKYGFSREYIARVYDIPEYWVREMFEKLKDSTDLYSERIARVDRSRKLGLAIYNYCKERGISRDEYDLELEKEYPLELIEKQLIIGVN